LVLEIVAEVGEALTLPHGGTIHRDATGRSKWGPHPIPPEGIAVLEHLLLDLATAERVTAGLPLFTPHAPLMDAARRHTLDMGLRPQLFHSDPKRQYRVLGCSDCGVGENVGRCPGGHGMSPNDPSPKESVGAIHRTWMASPGHRANILEPAFRLIGVSAVLGADLRFYATQAFLG
jgi:uncharacterized protein YkwD